MLEMYQPPRDLAATIGVTRIARLTGLDRTGVEVASAMRPGGHILQVSNGKGRDWPSAARGALHEAAELWAAEQPLPFAIDAAAEELEGALPAQWLGGEAAGPLRSKWVRAQRLDGAGQLWVPASAVSCPRVGAGPMPAPWTSNAMGAHRELSAALLHASYEGWEREALAQVLPQGWVPRDFAGRRLDWKGEGYEGFELAVFDLTPKQAVAPVAGALLRDLEGGPIPLTAGYAARPTLAAAIEAAVLEAAQSRQTEIQAAREDVMLARPIDVEGLWSQVRGCKRSRRATARGPATAAALARKFRRPVAFVELAPGRLPIRVVKVLVPGFRVSELLQ